jgi:hypothetical protein
MGMSHCHAPQGSSSFLLGGGGCHITFFSS